MQRNLKNGKTAKTNKGITLVALVITIIVLLILAGVAINMAINSDGLFGKANEAAEGWNESVENESMAIGDLLTELDKVSPMAVEISTELPKGWDSNKVKEVATAVKRQAPIPKGFTVSAIEGENTIGGGLVIYQTGDANTEAEGFWTEKDENGYLTCQTTYNQYVWIPVDDINQMVMCKLNNKDNDGTVCNLVIDNGVFRCKTHNVEGDNITEICGRLFCTGKTTSTDFTDRTQKWPIGYNGDQEPRVLSTTYDNEENTDGLTVFTSQMIEDFTNMAISVEKYGGFYVSRYEAGENGNSKRNQIVITAGAPDPSQEVYNGVTMWYGLYKEVHNEIAVGTSTMQSHMVYGSQYDQIINFIGSQAQEEHPGKVVENQSLSGNKDSDKLNNIYDLEGNNFEWIATAYGSGFRVFRGGRVGESQSASYRGANRTNLLLTKFSTRVSLYL